MGASRQFYEKLGFEMAGGDESSWLILRNGETTIGLFHGLFEGNILTFNPGWGVNAEELDEFSDIRQIRAHLVDQGLNPADDTTQESEAGPASFTLIDPDGNPILVDQHR
jgi:lactoylglutathione lyase